MKVLYRTSSTYYRASLARDEELARHFIEHEEEMRRAGKPLPKPEVALEDWSPEVAELTKISDRIAELINVSVAAAGGKPVKLRPSPRPATAYERLSDQARVERHFDLVEEVEAAQERLRKI